MNFMKHRFEIWSPTQHPMKHSLADFSFTNPALPGVTNLEGTINWILAVLYPNTQAAVADVASLPAVGNTINDYRVVLDDGDGNAASYRWEQREGEVSASWHKIYDMDWGSDSILAAYQNRTQDLYVHKRGYDDLDATGVVVASIYAGQTVTGGLSANSHLTLRANAGDGTGSRTGYIQFDDQIRPTVNNTFDFGTASYKLKDGYFAGTMNSATTVAGTLSLTSGSITDSSGSISFNDENLTSTGTIQGAIVRATFSFECVVSGQTIAMYPGAITDTTGAITFSTANLSTSGTLTSGSHTVLSPLGNNIVLSCSNTTGSLVSSTGAITFGSNTLTTTGNLNAGAVYVDMLIFDGQSLSTSSTNDLYLSPGGVVVVTKHIYGSDIDCTGYIDGAVSVAGGNLTLSSNTLSSTNANGNITLTPNGTGEVISSALLKPGGDNTLTLGTAAARWSTVYLGTGIHDGTTSISSATLQSLRDINSGVAAGMTLFWDGSKWAASAPDTEVDHGSISGLSDDDHSQYMLLAGRAGGQALVGGTASGEHITLESTAHASKGFVKTKDDLVPNTNASYSGGWSGTNLGGASNYFKDLYTKGEAIGLRFQNYTVGTLPSPSAQNVGRVVFATDDLKAYIDTGTTFKVLGVSKSITDTSWNGSDLTKNVTVSADVSDARNCLWQLRDNANDFEILAVKITTPNATTVTITTTIALPSGTYRLIGAE
jgi:hypothetical protein